MILTKFLIGNSKKEEIEAVALKKKYFHILSSYPVFMIPQCSQFEKLKVITGNSWKTMVKSTRSETQCSLYFVNKITFISAQDWYAFKHRYMFGERNIVF